MDQEQVAGKGYALSGKIMLSAVIVLFAVIISLVGVHLYLRWYFSHLHLRREQRRRRRTHVVFYTENQNPRAAADRGLAPEVLKSLPVIVFSPESWEAKVEEDAPAAEQPLLECAVCLCEFEENDVVRLLPKCNHSFHIGCIDMWFHSHSTCPLCRSAVEPVDDREKTVPAAGGNEEVCVSDPGQTSGSGFCSTCQHEGNGSSRSGRMKANGGAAGIRIEVATPRLSALECELTQNSPGARFASLRRIFSMSLKSPVGSCGSPRSAAGTSGGATDLDLEAGVSEPVRVERTQF